MVWVGMFLGTMFLGTVVYADQPRPIVQVVSPDGVLGVVPGYTGGRWGVPAGKSGSYDKPILLEEVDAVSFRIGDRINSSFLPGSSEVNGLNPQTTFPVVYPRALGVFCVGCNGPKPSMTILSWKLLPRNLRLPLVARVSLGVDATDPRAVYNDSNSILTEIWFKRGGVIENQPPEISVSDNQTVRPAQTVFLRATVIDPNQDPTTVSWSQLATSTTPSVRLNGASSTRASFVAPNQETTLKFQCCASDSKASPVCARTTVYVREVDEEGPPPEDDSEPEVVCNQEGNQPAVVQGPSDRTVEGGDRVRLTGGGYDPDRTTSGQGFTGVSFSWAVLEGGGVLTTSRLSISHGEASSTASFTAPSFSQDTTLVLRFSAFDPLGCGSHDPVRIFVRASNNQPEADAGRDQEVMETEQVTLYGSGSDPDGDRLSYHWSQRSGPAVELLQGAGGQNHFLAPRVEETTELTFRLLVDDGNGGEDSDEVQITVQDNRPPELDRLLPQTVEAGERVTLVASASDPEGDALSYAWRQRRGPSVSLSSRAGPRVSFTAPEEGEDAELVFEVVVTDSYEGQDEGEVLVTVEGNEPPVVEPVEDQEVGSGKTVTLEATAYDPDGDELTYQWSQDSGPSVRLAPSDEAVVSFEAPTVQEQTELGLTLSVSDGLSTVERRARIQVKPIRRNTLVLPTGARTQHKQFEDTYIGVAIVNLSEEDNGITLSGRDSDGNEQLNQQLQRLEGQGQDAFLTDELVGANGELSSLVASGDQGLIQGFFMMGDYEGRRLDGVGGTSVAATTLYFPLARQRGDEEATLLFLFNDGTQPDPGVLLRLCAPDGTLLQETSVAIAAQGSIVGTLSDLFGPTVALEDGYVQVQSTLPLRGFEFLAGAEDFSSMTAQVGTQTRQLVVPHLFVDRHGGDTEIRLINVGNTEALVSIQARDDRSQPLGTAQVRIAPKELFVGSARELLGLDPTGLIDQPAITGHLKLATTAGKLGPFQRAATLVGVASFVGNHGRFRSTLPMIEAGQKETLLLQVAQSETLRMFTGIAILNCEERATEVRVEAFSETGEKTAERRFVLEPGHRLVDVLNGPSLFGLGFEQVKGHLRIVSEEPVLVFALFGDFDSQFLSSIEGQAPLQ